MFKNPAVVYRAITLLLIAFSVIAVLADPIQTTPDCKRRADALLKRTATGTLSMNRLSNKQPFYEALNGCDDLVNFLATGVHEGVHALGSELSGYPLVNGQLIKTPQNLPKLLEPRVIGDEMKKTYDPNDETLKTYITGPVGQNEESSKNNFLILLDELNAYTHDVNVTSEIVDLIPKEGANYNHRDGLSYMMNFVSAYANRAKATHPATWKELNSKPLKDVVQKLWTQAEAGLSRICSVPRNLGFNDQPSIQRLCGGGNHQAMESILGRSIQCPNSCPGVKMEVRTTSATPAVTPPAAAPPARTQGQDIQFSGSDFIR